MKISIASLVFIALLALSSNAMAHTPLFTCIDNGDNSITCEGGFSDGSSAANVPVRVLDESGKALIESALDKNSEVTFARPQAAFTVLFDAGQGHTVSVPGSKIVK